jgi:hypothetical protein
MRIRGDERGMLVELLPSVAAVLILVSCAATRGWRGLLIGAAIVAGVVALMIALVSAAALTSRFVEIPAVRRALASAPARAFAAAFPYLLVGALGGGLGVFFAIVVAPSFVSEPAAQLRAFGLSGLTGAALFSGLLALARRRR